MISRASLPITFWGYEIETTTHILNLFPILKVSKTPHEIWIVKVPLLNHINVLGFEVFVLHETQEKLDSRSERCFLSITHKILLDICVTYLVKMWCL